MRFRRVARAAPPSLPKNSTTQRTPAVFARIILPCLISLAATFLALTPWAMVSAQAESKKPSSVFDFNMKDIEGKDVPLSRFQGKVLLIVNTASQCGNTPQY